MILYKTPAKEAVYEEIIERSRFLAHIKPVSCREEAEIFIATIRGKYKDATHNVPAMVIGDKMQIQWASDDGEPQGTSGAPMVQLLVGEGVTNAVIVVTRYFGGIKLGTGGLVRAYTGAAKGALAAAGIREVAAKVRLVLSFAYTYLDKMTRAFAEAGYEIENTAYEADVTVTVVCKKEDAKDLKELVTGLTKGTICFGEETPFEG